MPAQPDQTVLDCQLGYAESGPGLADENTAPLYCVALLKYRRFWRREGLAGLSSLLLSIYLSENLEHLIKVRRGLEGGYYDHRLGS